MRKKRMVRKVLVVPEAFERYCRDFNDGRFFEAHEHLEEIWQFERGSIRDLYKGLIQAAAAYVHLQRGGYPGALRLLTTSVGYLQPYRDHGAMGFDVEFVASVLEAAQEELLRLGAAGAFAFPLSLRPPMTYDRNALQAEARHWKAWGFDEDGRPVAMEVTVAV